VPNVVSLLLSERRFPAPESLGEHRFSLLRRQKTEPFILELLAFGDKLLRELFNLLF
jgi:hypothetical protein